MKKLYDLDPAEVSLVPRGANRKKFLIFKSRKGSGMAANQEIQNLVNMVHPETMAKVEKIVKTFCKKADGDMPPRKDSAVFKEPHGAGEEEPMNEPLSERAQAALKAIARIMSPFKDELTSDHVGAVAHEVGLGGSKTEAADEATPEDEELEHMDKSFEAVPEGVEEEHHAEALNMARKSYGEHLKKMGYRKYPDAEMQQKMKSKSADMQDEDDEDEDETEGESVGKISKSLDLSAFPKGQRSQLEQVFKSHNALARENKEQISKIGELQEELKFEKDLRLKKEYLEKAKSFKHLGANTEKLATVLKTLAEKDVDAFKEVEAVLKAADRQIAVGGSLYGEIGTRGTSDATDPEARLNALVESVVAKADGSKSRHEIYEQVLKTAEGKRLYGEYKNSRNGGI